MQGLNMDNFELYGNDIDWSSVTLPEGTSTSLPTSTSPPTTVPFTTTTPTNTNISTNTNSNNDNLRNHRTSSHTTIDNSDNTLSNLQERLKQMEVLLAEKDARLFDLESSMATLEAETQYSIQSAQRSQQMIQEKEQDIKLMKQMVEKKNMVIVRLQNKKRGREGHTLISSPSDIPEHPHQKEELNYDHAEVLSTNGLGADRMHHQMSSIVVQTDRDPGVAETVAITDPTNSSMHHRDRSSLICPSSLHQNAFQIISQLPSMHALHFTFSSEGDHLSISQLCRLILSRLSSTEGDADVLVALLDLCTVDAVSREYIRRSLYKEKYSMNGTDGAVHTSFVHSINTSRIRGIKLPTRTNFDASTIQGRFDVMKILMAHIFFKTTKKNSQEDDSIIIPEYLQQSKRHTCLKIILGLMCDAPASSTIWNGGMSFMDEYFSNVIEILEQHPSEIIDYTNKQLLVDIMHFTCVSQRDRADQFFFQDIDLLERLIRVFLKDIQHVFHQIEGSNEESSSFPLLTYLGSLVRFFGTWVHFKRGFDMTRTQLKYDGDRVASCVGVVLAILQKALHLNDAKGHDSYLSKQVLHQLIQFCVQFFHNLLCASELLELKRSSLLIDILQDAGIINKLIFCLQNVIIICAEEDCFVSKGWLDKTRNQALLLLQVLDKGIKSM